MLINLTIRDVVLIERLDLAFGPGLTVLTGETGAGKSILLDSLGLALGQRADAGLVRAGQSQAAVTAAFLPPPRHPAFDILQEQGIAAEDTLVLRRILQGDGRSRAFVNDQPVGVGLLRRIGALLVDIHGQHEQFGLADPTTHAGVLDAFGALTAQRGAVAAAWSAWRSAARRCAEAEAALTEAKREEEWLRHAVHELAALAPASDEEERLAAERQQLQQGERRAEAIAAALAELAPRDRRSPSPGRALREAARALERLPPPRGEAETVLAQLNAAAEALAEAQGTLERLVGRDGPDPRRLEAVEERLFALRAAARKYAVSVAELPGLAARLREQLAALDAGVERLEGLRREEAAARFAYGEAATTLSVARRAAAAQLAAAVARELPPLRLERARVVVEVTPKEEAGWGPEGQDRVSLLFATTPGQEPGPLAKIASGGELSRLMLALKAVLARSSAVPTLIFDEVDAGVGGATAAAVGERLARIAQDRQVLVVTHSPQVAARARRHLQVSKEFGPGGAIIRVEELSREARREELARMLAGERITDAARAAAESLLADAP